MDPRLSLGVLVWNLSRKKTLKTQADYYILAP